MGIESCIMEITFQARLNFFLFEAATILKTYNIAQVTLSCGKIKQPNSHS